MYFRFPKVYLINSDEKVLIIQSLFTPTVPNNTVTVYGFMKLHNTIKIAESLTLPTFETPYKEI